MKKTIFSLILLTFTLLAKPNDFSVIIDKPFNDALLDITQDYDRSISAVGFSNKFVKSNQNANQTYTNAFDYLSSISEAFGAQMHIVKVNPDGSVALSKSAKLAKFNEAVALVKTPSNGYFVGGYTLDGSLIVLKADSNANLIFSKTFGTSNYDRMNNLILLSDGGVLAVGSSVTSRSENDNMFETGLGQNDIYLTRFSKNGRRLWSKKYGTEYDDRGIDAVEARDGSIIVIATTSHDKNKNITLMRINENGNKIWLKHYKSEKTVTPHKIIRLRDNNFLLSLSQQNEMQKEQIRLIKFDLQKNIILDKFVNTTYSSVLKDIKEFSDSNVVAVGYVRDSYNTDALTMILDSELNMLHQEHYGDDNFDIFNAVTILNNSQVAVAGINTSKDSQESNMWIVKLNRDGTMAQLSSSSVNIYDDLKKIFASEIRNHKLIIKEDLTIEFLDKNLYFNVGEYNLNEKQKNFLATFSDKLLPFMKKHQNNVTSFEINGHTSSEWGDTNFTNEYLNNEKLSMNRAYSTISYIFKRQNAQTQRWFSKIIKGSGFSSSKKVMFNDTEDKEKSRRVSFKILLK